MSDGGQDPSDLIRLWLERQAGAFVVDGASNAAWDRAEGIFRAWNQLASAFGPATAGGTGAAAFDPSRWMTGADDGIATVLRGVLSSVGLADLPGGGAGAESWQRYKAALDRYRAITGAAWLAAFREFAERARRDADDARRHGREPPAWDDLQDLWHRIADREFAETHRSEEFLEAQAALMQAGLDARRQARARVEAVADALGLPTRAEVDDLTETVHALRREVAALKAK